MKKTIISAFLALIALVSPAQEKMKIVLTNGTTAEYDVKKIQQVYFEGQEVKLTTGSATNISEKGATLSVDAEGVEGTVVGGIILSANKNVNYENSQYVFAQTLKNGRNTFQAVNLSSSTTYYYRAFAKVGDDYIYGSELSFTTSTPAPTIIYKEPYTNWGASVAQTKSYMSGYSLYNEGDNSLAYLGNNLELLIMYNFENSKLYAAQVAIKTDKTTMSKIQEQLTRNSYISAGTTADGTPAYVSNDSKTIVFVETNTDLGAYMVRYFDVAYFQTSTETLFSEPYTNWGATLSTVRTAVQNLGYKLWREDSTNSGGYYLAFNGKDKETYDAYYFNAAKTLTNVEIVFDASTVSLESVREYLSSDLSYTFAGTNSAKTQFFYLTKDKKSYAIAYSSSTSNGTQLTIVDYVSYSSVSSGARIKTRGGEEFFDEYVPANRNSHIANICFNCDRIWEDAKTSMSSELNFEAILRQLK